MFNPLMRNPLIFNKSLSEYCRNSTNESIRKLKEKYESKKYIPNIKITYSSDENDKPDFNFYVFLVFLSISSLSLFFYKRIKE